MNSTLACLTGVFVLASACTAGAPPADSVPATADETAIHGLLETYARAYATADADLMESLFWLDDERFVEIEDHIPVPFGRDTFLSIMGWIRENQEPGGAMAFREPRVYLLGPSVATSVSLQDIGEGEEKTTSRVLLVYLKKGGAWRIIQGHFSSMPG